MNARPFLSLFLPLTLCSTALAQKAPPPEQVRPAPAASDGVSVEQFDLEKALISDDARALSADEAGQRARTRAPQIASAEAVAEGARYDSETQWSGYLPVVTFQGTYRRLSRVTTGNIFNFPDPSTLTPEQQQVLPVLAGLFGGDDNDGRGSSFIQPPNNYAFSANARVPVSDLFLRVWPAYQASKGIADARAIEVETRRAVVDLTAREAFYAHARALAAMLVAEQALRQAEAQAAQAKLFVDAGTAAPVDYLTASARVASMRSSLARGKGVVAVTRNTLATYTGVEGEQIRGIKERVTTLPQGPDEDVDTLLARGLERRPELRALRKLLEASGEQRRAERGAMLPTLSVDGTVLYANPNLRYLPIVERFKTTWEVGATLAWSPNATLVGHQRSQRASADIERARGDLAAMEDGVRIEVVQAYEDYKAADAAARASEEQQRAAEETYRVRLATYRVGAGVQIDLLAADLALTQARMDHLNAVIDARIALARLARATGEAR